MIMRIVQQTQVYLCEFRTQLAYDLEEYEAGRRTTGVFRNGSRYDDTQDRNCSAKAPSRQDRYLDRDLSRIQRCLATGFMRLGDPYSVVSSLIYRQHFKHFV
jgi:hypothetical protein